MKRILALIASQRKLANGEIIAKEVAASIGEEYELELVRLTDLNLDPCRACYVCLVPDKQCPIDDGLYYLIEKIKEADGIIIASPEYVLGPAAITKVLTDRMIAIAQDIDGLWGKPCVVIGTYGIKGWEGYTMTALNSLTRFMGFDLKDSHLFLGALPGEGIIGEGALERAREMGKALFGEGRKARKGECPTCWSDVWRFERPDTAVCPICNQKATLSMGESGIKWTYGEAGTRFEKEHLKEHFQVWLKEQVEEFIKRRKELGEVKNRYKGDDTWVRH